MRALVQVHQGIIIIPHLKNLELSLKENKLLNE